MSNQVSYKNLIAFHPGSYVEDIINDLNITQEEFAMRLEISPKVLSTLINAEIKLSPEVALKLESLTGIDYQTWMNLQNQYDRKIIKIEEEKNQDEQSIINMIDIKYFKDNSFIEKKRYDLKEKIKTLRNILNISSLSYLIEFNPNVSYRNVNNLNECKTIVNSNIMLELASNMTRNVTNNKLNKDKLKYYLPKIREMSLQKPEDFYTNLKETLLSCGIVLCFLPSLKNSSLHGATKKFKNGSVLLLVTDRNKSADIFWFSLIHEIAHILNNDFYTDRENINEYKRKEKIANEFAKNFFISENDYDKFVKKGDFTERAILDFSKKNKTKPFILIGRLKKDKIIEYSKFQKYNEKYKIIINYI